MGSIIVSVILFVLSLLIFFAVRSADKKTRSLQNVNMQIKNFRSESQSMITDMKTTSQDCIDNVQSHVAQARSTYEAVNGTLERLQAHKNDLTNLEGVCVNYKMSLEKLKTETEHVEARITNVQRETMKLEEIYSASRTFQEEADTLINQIQDFKAEYVRLVASTQESLKQQAMLQKKENSDMLSSFQSILERQKAQFVEFMNNEKLGFQRECEDQLRIAETTGDKVRASRSEIEESLKVASTSFGDMKTDFRTFLETADKRIAEGKDSVDVKIEMASRSIQERIEAENKKLDESLEAFQKNADDILEEYSRKRTSQEEDLRDRQEAGMRLLDEKKDEIAEYLASVTRDVESLSINMDKEKKAYLESTRVSYREALVEELDQARESLDSLLGSIGREINELSGRSSEIRVATDELGRQSLEKISESVARLSELGDKIRESEQNLTDIQEEITGSKENIYRLQQDQEKIEKLIDDSRNELKDMKERISESRGERLELESDIAKLKLEKIKESEVEDKESEAEKRAHSIIEEFPEDIFIGDEEEISLDDDDEDDDKVDD